MSRVRLPKEGRLVIVKWRDAASDGGWTLDVEHDELVVCTSVGYLMFRDKHRIVLTASKNEAGQLGQRGAIPRVNITDVRKLRIGKRA